MCLMSCSTRDEAGKNRFKARQSYRHLFRVSVDLCLTIDHLFPRRKNGQLAVAAVMPAHKESDIHHKQESHETRVSNIDAEEDTDPVAN